MAGLDNKISNIIGTKIPQWVLNQLGTRSIQNSKDSRDNDNILYLANKSAWIRLVSSVDIVAQNDLSYFKNIAGSDIQDQTSLAKQFVLFGGTSKYLNKNSYQLRSGIGQGGAYGTLGESEINAYGYKPMPGITSVNIDTQGRLGSIRAATINFKCWDKSQLDIIDALYFKLGFTMFLEWGHTYFYPNFENNKNLDPNKIQSTELYSIDPFESKLNKEQIFRKISQNSRDTEGNYDAMLGIVTNFNFTYTQDGGYDCTLRLMSLGVLGDSIKINSAPNLPDLLQEEITKYNNTLARIEKARLDAEAARNAANTVNKTLDTQINNKISAVDFVNKYIKYDSNRTSANKYSGGQVSWPSNSPVNNNTFDATFHTDAYGWVYFIRKQNGFIPDNILESVKINLDADKILTRLNNATLNGVTGFSDPRIWTIPNNYLESLKTAASAPITTVVNLLNTLIDFKKVTIDSGETELDKINDTAVINVNYSSQNTLKYSLRIERKLWAISDRTDIVDSYSSISNGLTYSNSAYYYIDTPTFVEQFKRVLNSPNNTFTIKSIESIANKTTTNIEFLIPFTRSVKISIKGTDLPDVINPDGTVTKGGKTPDTITDAQVTFTIPVKLSIDDSSFIKSFTTPDSVIQPLDFISKQNLVNQNQTQNVQDSSQTNPGQSTDPTQTKQAITSQSSLELILRTIQVRSLTNAINKSGLDIGRKVYNLELYKETNFLNQIFSTGLMSSFITDLASGSVNIKDSSYDTSEEDRFKINCKYGFATSLLGYKEEIGSLTKNNFEETLNAYAVPYEINQEIAKGTDVNHPVYIPFGLLLMILNHCCTIYDTKKGSTFQTPLVYVDFNNQLNFFLCNGKQLSTNPWKVLIPFEGTNEDYKKLFDPSLLDKGGIKALSGSAELAPLFTTQEDALSKSILPVKYTDIDSSVYRGKIMNILLNIEYLIDLVKDNSYKDGGNNVYLKPFIEQILFDVNKYLGDFNSFRLSYNDQANTFQIVDDQFIPSIANEIQWTKNDKPDSPNTTNRTEIPLVGKYSIAKSLEIKTDISSKLANMIAISSNSTIENKATLSNNGDSIGYVNTNFQDRYITDKLELSGSKSQTSKELETLKIAARHFNQTVKDFYTTINPSETSVSDATNYYIEKMSKVKNNEKPTRAAAMIPVSINFSTDGISGLGMGQSFTVADELLPYSYDLKRTGDYDNNVGFAMVGLNHSIENNTWNTTVRANMIYLKDKTVFNVSASRPNSSVNQFGVNLNNQSFSYSVVEKSPPIDKEKAIKITKTFFEQKGYNRVQVSAIIGGLLQESNLNPNAENPTSKAYGVAQWLGIRKDKILAKSDYSKLETQLAFVYEEFNGAEASAGKKLKLATTLEDAITAMATYERYAGVTSDSNYQQVIVAKETGNRIGYTKYIYNNYDNY